MRLGTAIVLAVLGAAAVGAAIELRPHTVALPAGQGKPMFAGLAVVMPQAARVEITDAGKTTTLVLQKGQWDIAERGLYPAAPPKLRELFAGLNDLRLIEPRTADPALYARLGVDNPKQPNSTATLLRVKTQSGAVLAELILGHSSQRSQSGLPEAYVRRPGEAQAWLAESRLPVDADPQSWLLRDIVDVPRARIASVVVQRGGERLEFLRKGDGMMLVDPPLGKPDELHINEMGQSLEGVTMADVRPGVLPGTTLGSTVITTTDGLVMTVTLNKDGTAVWASFSASGTGTIYAHLAGWAYQLPEWREKSLLPAASDMVAEEPAKSTP